MPIGTQSTAILLKQYAPLKTTRKPKAKVHHHFWTIFFETLLITIVSVAAGALTDGLTTGFVASLGASELTTEITSFAARTLIEFAINQTADVLQNQVTPKTTALNLLLPASFNIGKITRGFRTAKILRLAKDTKVLAKLSAEDAKNINQIIERLSNTQLLTKEINGKNQIFNFGKLNREQVLQDIGFVAQSTFKYDFKNLTKSEIKENLLLQTNLEKLSSKLLPKLKIQDMEKVNDFLSKFGVDYETVIKMNQFDWLNLIGEIQKTNSGKSLILTLQQIRNNIVKYNFSNNFINNSLTKINKISKYFNINYYIDKGLDRFWENPGIFTNLKEKLLILLEKSEITENQTLDKIKTLVKRSRQIISKTEKLAVQKFKLIPLDSPLFLACKINPINLNNAVVTVFHHDTNKKPIFVIDSFEKVSAFIKQKNLFAWYLNENGWPINYEINKNNQILSKTMKKIIEEGLTINLQIKNLNQKITLITDDRLFINKIKPINIKRISSNNSSQYIKHISKSKG